MGVVVDIPPCAFEAEAGRGERALQQAVALGAFLLFLSREALDLFKFVAALSAAIGIQRQGVHTLQQEMTAVSIVSGTCGAGDARYPLAPALLRPTLAEEGITRVGHPALAENAADAKSLT